jgi:hypothetical protein
VEKQSPELREKFGQVLDATAPAADVEVRSMLRGNISLIASGAFD